MPENVQDKNRARPGSGTRRIVLSAREAFNGTVYESRLDDNNVRKIFFPAGVSMTGETINLGGVRIPVAVNFQGISYRAGKDGLEYTLPLSVSEVMRGGKVENIPTPWGPVVFTIPPKERIGGIDRLACIGWPIKTKSSDLTDQERTTLGITKEEKSFWLSAAQLKLLKRVSNLYIRTELVAEENPRSQWNPFSPEWRLFQD